MRERAIADSARSRTAILVGLESCGKSALFRVLTGRRTGDEANFRGSTVQCRIGRCRDAACGGLDIVDAPGLRFDDDSVTTRLALGALDRADVAVLVVRGTHVRRELTVLLGQLAGRLSGLRICVVATFADRVPKDDQRKIRELASAWAIPVRIVCARRPGADDVRAVYDAVANAARPARLDVADLPAAAEPRSLRTPLESPRWGSPLALAMVLLLYGGPVYLAFWFSTAIEPLLKDAWVTPIVAWLGGRGVAPPSVLGEILVGGYGVVTLGFSSFVWAFPVVAILGASVALLDEIGLKDRMAAALDPWLRRVGLDGRDLAPLLSGYGCKVVAVLSTRTSGRCSRAACVSLISLGTACSYQMGAALSLFGAAQRPGLFLPYIGLLFVAGAVHTRLWYGRPSPRKRLTIVSDSALQAPMPAAVWWRLLSSARQFLLQAMPAFLLICVAASLLSYVGALDKLASAVAPALALVGLPGQAAPAFVFSLLRKDGLMVANQPDLLERLGGGGLIVLVFLGSALTACLVTLWTIGRELGVRSAFAMIGKQAVTVVAVTALLAAATRIF